MSVAAAAASRAGKREAARFSRVGGRSIFQRIKDRKTAVGSAPASVDYGSRIEGIESRLMALEGGAEPVSDVTQPSTTPPPVETPGDVVGFDPRTAAFDAMANTPKAPGMGAGLAASQDIFGSEFARNSAVGAAKMIKNKKI